VLTAAGSTPVSRSAASILRGLGMDDWVAPAINRYEDVALARAADLDGIRVLRGTLRERLAASPFMDEARYVDDFQQTLRRLWAAHCRAS
jgi:protein O-GlcNAc transferase